MLNHTLKTLFVFTILTLLSLPICGQIENNSVPSLAVDKFEAELDTIIISVEEYNGFLLDSKMEPITEDDPLVRSDGSIWMFIEKALPEEGEDELEIGVPLVETYGNWLEKKIIIADQELPILTGVSISGLDFDTDASLSGFYHIPPDPSGAVGTTHLCHVVNTSIDCHTKAGASVSGFPQELEDFYASLAPENDSFDPKILWDQYENRFVAITLVKTTSPDTSRILLAVSATADPTGTWYYQAIDAKKTISSNTCWFDYPGFAVDEQAIYVTGNYFRFSNNASCGQSHVLIIDKGLSGGIYSGTTSADDDPSTNSNFDFYHPATEGGAGFNGTLQPAHTFGTPPTNMGTWLVTYSGLSNGTQEFFEFYEITNPLSSPTFSRQLLNVGDFDDTSAGMIDAPQLGNATGIETNDRRTLNAVWHNDKLWVTTSIMPSLGDNSGEATAYYFQFNADGAASVSTNLSGEIGGEDIASDTHTFFPSVAVNSSGNAAISFCASASSIHAGAYAISIDGASGALSGSTEIQSGKDDYVRTFGGSSNRWGDYGRMALDPSDDDFWVFQPAANTNGTVFGGEDGRWQIYIEELQSFAAALPVEWLSFEVRSEENNAFLQWRTLNEIDNMGFSIERYIDQRFVEIGFVEGQGTTSEVQTYEFKVSDLQEGTHSFRLRQIDYNQDYTYSNIESVEIIVPRTKKLGRAFPNPFSKEIQFDIALKEEESISINILDINGRVVSEIYSGMLDSGRHNFKWDGAAFAAGMYLISVQANEFIESQRIILRKIKE